ncbi:hypothetical protein [Streptomyces sp. NPDC092952]|uniref:hypothetical protein n=1 Tax=Streptomyces sp. NPDC092952 TaxID=3366018 RepID=UPI003807D6EC
MVEHPWVRCLRPCDTSVLVAAVSDEATLREARLQIGGAVGRAVETSRPTDATAPARSAGPSRTSGDLTARCAEALALHFLRSLAGFPTDDLPDVTGQSVRESIRQNLPVGLSTLWAWGAKVSGDPCCSGGRAAPRRPGRPGHAGVHIAAGLPGEGIEGFRTSHRQVGETAELIRAVGPGAVVRSSPYNYADLELVIPLRSRRDRSAAFGHRELGPLADDGMSELRATVKCYLDTERSMSAVGRLHIAKSRVAYRIRKAEHLLGRPVKDNCLRL